MLSAPWIVGPITPCSRYVLVEGLLPRATVRLFRDGTVPIGMTTAQLPFEFVELGSSVELEPGALISATQEKDGEVSEHSPVPYLVLLPPSAEAFDRMFFLAPPVQCGTCLSLGGIVPGATVTVELNGNQLTPKVAKWATVTVPVPDGISVGAVPTPITVRQYGCGNDRGGVMSFPAPLKLETGPVVPDLPAPAFDPPPQACQRLLHLTGIQPGASVRIERENGTILSSCFGFTEGDIVLPDLGLNGNESMKVWQQYDTRECRRSGQIRKVRVEPGRPEAPSFVVLPREGDVFASIGNLVPGAVVHLFRDDDTQPFLVGAATRRISNINLPSGWSANRLSVRQAVCDGGPFSEPTIVRVRPAAPPIDLRLVEPLVACSTAVAVKGLEDEPPTPQAGFNAGTHLRVFSQRWHGVIGEAVAMGDWYTTIDLWFPLLAEDRISVDASRGGVSRTAPQRGTEPEPPSVVTLPPPDIDLDLDGRIDDCTGSIGAISEPGLIVDIEQVPGPAFPSDTAGILLASVRHGGARSLPVPPLEPNTLVRARARRCGRRSEPADAVLVVDRGPVYLVDTTFRLCQLTGASDPVSRPHHQDTREISLSGTDLGIPVDHRGTLWFFFGDTDAFEFGPFSFYGDDDGFAWTEDDPEPDGPRLHFVTDDTDVFVTLLEEQIGGLSGAILGVGLGALVTQIGVAGAIAGGVAGAALGALVGWMIDIVPDKRFRQLAVQGLPDLKNFEVPSGGFSFDDRLFLFIAREKYPLTGPTGKMRASHLAVSAGPDPSNNFKHVFNVSLMISDLPAAEVPSHLNSADFKGGQWLVHVSPVRVRNADWSPDLPSDVGDGLLLFGTDNYHAANMYVAWAPLTPGQLPPPPESWLFYVGNNNTGKSWMTLDVAKINNLEPHPLCPDAPGLGELSVSWSPGLRRWIMTSESGRVRYARRPQGPWTFPDTIFDGNDVLRAADNIAPDGSPRWVGLTHAEDPSRKTGTYAPYQVPSWIRVDRSIREVTIYYTLSLEHPPYNTQLMRSRLRGN